MRIVGGKWRGRPLESPKDEAKTRPTSERAREAIFSMLTSRIGSFEGLQVADLFAGTGALGLEALSRGAAHCTFVERDPWTLRRNVEKFGADATIRPQPAENFGHRGAPLDLVFVDPPYGRGGGIEAIEELARTKALAPGALVIVETAADEAVAIPGFEVDTVRRYGKAKISLLRYLPN